MNDAAYQHVDAIWKASENLDYLREIEPLRVPAGRRAQAWVPRFLVGLGRAKAVAALTAAAATVILIIGGVSLNAITDPNTFATDTGDLRLVELTEGSSVHLGPRSRISVRYREEQY